MQPHKHGARFGKMILCSCPDAGRLSSNGVTVDPVQSETPLGVAPTSGPLMADKMRLGRQDQPDSDSGQNLLLYWVHT